MNSPDLGKKRRCTECEAAFYDLNRSPITCPKCGAVHQPVARLKSDGRTPPKGRVFTKRKPQPEPAVAGEAPAIDADFDATDAADKEEAEVDEDEQEEEGINGAEIEDDPETPAEGDEPR